jgi:type VII secretion protein EccB
MATKKELIEAQGYSRRRLLSAFIGGAPGGKELEPAQPLRAVIAGITLTAMVLLGGVFYGIIRPGLPKDWENNRLILASDTGARYVSIDGTLYPVINTASARLMIDPSEFKVITTDQATLEGIEIGATVGILGAPDSLATPELLINDGWSACRSDEQTSVAISTQIQAIATNDSTVVSVGDSIYVISGEMRYAVDPSQEAPILRALGLSSISAEEVDGNWLNLFTEGADLEPIIVPNAGQRIAGTDLEIGTVVNPQGTSDSNLFLITENAELAELSPLAYQLYLLGTGQTLGEVREASPADLADLPNEVAGGNDWPTTALTPLATDGNTCALLTHVDGEPRTVLATLREDSQEDARKIGVTVERGHGALVYTGSPESRFAYLVDEAGTAYSIPAISDDILARLGYKEKDLQQVTAPWLAFMSVGPALDQEAAGKTPKASSSSK